MNSIFKVVALLCISMGTCSANTAQVLCSIEKPLAETGERVQLRAWVIPSGSGTPQMNWTVDSGSVDSSESRTWWVLENTQPGRHIASVSLPDSKNVECTLQLYVVPRERGGRESGRGFLAPGGREKPGYGLYSYFLLGAPPDDAARDRYSKAIAAHLRIAPVLGRLEELIDPKEVNAIYIFVDGTPDAEVTPDWVLQHYDYARARAILKNFPGLHLHGPYLISSASPVETTVKPTQPYLYQDLSVVPVSLVGPWYEEFLNQAAQDHFWEKRSGPQFVLRLRSAIAVLALGLPDVQKGVETWMKWSK